MNSPVNFDVSIDDSFEEPSHEEQKLESIRRISNIIQALENVVIQCEDNLDFAVLKKSIQSFLEFARRRLMHSIHQP